MIRAYPLEKYPGLYLVFKISLKEKPQTNQLFFPPQSGDLIFNLIMTENKPSEYLFWQEVHRIQIQHALFFPVEQIHLIAIESSGHDALVFLNGYDLPGVLRGKSGLLFHWFIQIILASKTINSKTLRPIQTQPNKVKYSLCYFVIVISAAFALPACAQKTRKQSRQSVSYRDNYQRFFVGSTAFHTMEVKAGTLWAYGNNQSGQLGDGTNTNQNIPVQIGSDNNWIHVATGGAYTLALKSDGTLWAWGRITAGQLGDGTTTDKNTPVRIGTDNNWVSIVAGAGHSLALKSNGTLFTWGSNQFGQLGDGTTTNRNIPTKVGTDNNWTGMSAGYDHSIALKSGGSLWGWGFNTDGQVGDGTTADKKMPAQIAIGQTWTSITSGGDHNLALQANGTLWAWGWNGYGKLGDGSAVSSRLSPVQIGTEPNWKAIATGSDHSLALKSNGTLWSWGRNTFGRLGDGSTTNRNSPVLIGNDNTWVDIAASLGSSFGLKADGTGWSWGMNNYGQLGNGVNTNHYSPVQTSNKIDGWLTVSTGENFCAGVKLDGTLWSWGKNDHGQVGMGTSVNQSGPVQIGVDNKWVSVVSGESHSLGLKANGTLWSWGANSEGQLGDGTTNDRNGPVQIGTDANWTSIAAAYNHSLALKANGTLWSWGKNNAGQLGLGNLTRSLSPLQIESNDRWISMSAGEFHTVALTSNGAIWAWGENSDGQLGDQSVTRRTSPVQIGMDAHWVAAHAGKSSSHGLKSNGTRWAWGSNENSALGDGDLLGQTNPTQVDNRFTWIALAAGTHNFGILADGTLWGWGQNDAGQLGDGSNVQRSTPVQIGTEAGWIKISAGISANTVGLKSPATRYCATGDNSFGQLGDLTTASKAGFVCNSASVVELCPPAASTTISSDVNGNTYQWQVSTAGTFSNIADGGSYINSNTPALQLLSISSSYFRYQYRCLVDGISSNIFTLKFLDTWTGASNSDWENPANWSCGAVPDENTDVVIKSGTVLINSNVTIRSLQLGAGATLIINSEYTFTILR